MTTKNGQQISDFDAECFCFNSVPHKLVKREDRDMEEWHVTLVFNYLTPVS